MTRELQERHTIDPSDYMTLNYTEWAYGSHKHAPKAYEGKSLNAG